MGAGTLRDSEKEAFWRATLTRQRQSGLSAAKFCSQVGLNENTFSSWKYIIRGRHTEATQETRGFRYAITSRGRASW